MKKNECLCFEKKPQQQIKRSEIVVKCSTKHEHMTTNDDNDDDDYIFMQF